MLWFDTAIGKLIPKCIFVVIISTKIFKVFLTYLSFVYHNQVLDSTSFMRLGQKSWKNIVGFSIKTIKPKRHFEINWPLEPQDLVISGLDFLTIVYCGVV